MIWLTDMLLVLAVPIDMLKILSHWGKADFAPMLAQGLVWILLAVLLRWLAGRRLRRARPEQIWLPWRKRILLTLIPLLVCAPVCVVTGINCYDYDLGIYWHGIPTDLLTVLHQWFSIATVVLIRVPDNVFSHREPDPAAEAADAE